MTNASELIEPIANLLELQTNQIVVGTKPRDKFEVKKIVDGDFVALTTEQKNTVIAAYPALTWTDGIIQE